MRPAKRAGQGCETGLGVAEVIEEMIARVPPPKGSAADPLQALIIDSWFDNYVGVVMLVRVVNGILKPKEKITLMAFCDLIKCHRRQGSKILVNLILSGIIRVHYSDKTEYYTAA